MKGLEFPIIGTKTRGISQKYDLNSPAGRKKYFSAKAGDEITAIRKYLKKNTFIAYFLGKKGSGKGTYSKLLTEIFGEDRLAHVSVGDVVRDAETNWKNISNSKKIDQLKRYYRGYIPFEKAVDALTNRSTKTLLPTEFVLALLKLYITQHEGKTIFIDGLPRDLDQVSYSLYFRDLINYRDDPDMFILIDIPESVIEARIKSRVVCPKCQTSRNTRLLVTSKLDYDPKTKIFYLLCDNPDCSGERMLPKEGDELGIKPLRPRLDKDEDILRKAFSLYGVPKVFLRNHVPLSEAKKYFDGYELTPEYLLSWDAKNRKVKVTEKPWIIKDDNKIESFSLLAPPVVVSLLKQLPEALGI